MDVAIVIPAYNEEQRLPATLRAWADYLNASGLDWQVIVVDDGSRDGTVTAARTVAASRPRLQVLPRPVNRGKGAAVRAGVLAAQAAVVFYTDADLNVAPETVQTFLKHIEHGADIVIGTRGARRYAATERSVSRVGAGLIIQGLRRALLFRDIRDTQCGFKAFRREAARAVFSRATVDGFAFDIEALFIARKLGLRITQQPVDVVFRPGSTYSVRRHLMPFLRDIVRIKRQDQRGVYRRPRAHR